MGVLIKAIEVKEYIGDDYIDDCDNALRVFSHDFSPIKHLTKFKEGVYNVEDVYNQTKISMPYSTYGEFRRSICSMIYDKNIDDVWDNIDEYVGKPFIELINFADNEGCFDYVIAEKLLKDFDSYQEEAKNFLNSYYYDNYCLFIRILKEAVDCKGAVIYT